MRDIKKLRELAEKATPGEWRLEFRRLIGPEIYRDCGDKIQMAHSKDAEFIAAFNPTTVLSLLDTIERYEKALRRLDRMVICRTPDFDRLMQEALNTKEGA